MTEHPNPELSLARWVRENVDRGASAAEEIHRAVADLPYRVFEQTGLFEQAAEELHQVQNRSIGAVYDLVRQVNRRVTAFAEELLGEVETRR